MLAQHEHKIKKSVNDIISKHEIYSQIGFDEMYDDMVRMLEKAYEMGMVAGKLSAAQTLENLFMEG